MRRTWQKIAQPQFPCKVVSAVWSSWLQPNFLFFSSPINTSLTLHTSIMGCCGEPRDPTDSSAQNRPISNGNVNGYPTGVQPTPQPQLQYGGQEKMMTPQITTPPPVQNVNPNVYNPNQQMWNQQQRQQMGQPITTPPPTTNVNQFGGYSPPPGPLTAQYTGTTLNGTPATVTVQRPNPVGSPVSSMSVSSVNNRMSHMPNMNAQANQRPDDGRMSISIDFGERGDLRLSFLSI